MIDAKDTFITAFEKPAIVVFALSSWMYLLVHNYADNYVSGLGADLDWFSPSLFSLFALSWDATSRSLFLIAVWTLLARFPDMKLRYWWPLCIVWAIYPANPTVRYWNHLSDNAPWAIIKYLYIGLAAIWIVSPALYRDFSRTRMKRKARIAEIESELIKIHDNSEKSNLLKKEQESLESKVYRSVTPGQHALIVAVTFLFPAYLLLIMIRQQGVLDAVRDIDLLNKSQCSATDSPGTDSIDCIYFTDGASYLVCERSPEEHLLLYKNKSSNIKMVIKRSAAGSSESEPVPEAPETSMQ